MPPKQRNIFRGDVQQLVDALFPHVSCASWIKYGPKVNPEIAVVHGKLVRACAAIQPNLSFTHKQVSTAIDQVVASKNIKISSTDAASYGDVMAARVRLLFRHVAQAYLKETTWGLEILGCGAPEAADATPASTMESLPGPSLERADVDYFYGFDHELKAAWRRRDGGTRELTTLIFRKDAEDELAPAWARWEDGHEHAITDLTGAMVDEMKVGTLNSAPKQKKRAQAQAS